MVSLDTLLRGATTQAGTDRLADHQVCVTHWKIWSGGS